MINYLGLVLLVLCLQNQVIAQSEKQDTAFGNISVAELPEFLEHQEVIFVDVRTPEEISEGKIEGAEEIDYRADDFETDVLRLDKDKTYLIYCGSGYRSAAAAKFMKAQGFMDIYNLIGGYSEWIKTQKE